MAWTVEWDERAVREAKKLDHVVRRRILDYLRERIATDEDPRRFCRIEDKQVVVLVLAVGHRRQVYR